MTAVTSSGEGLRYSFTYDANGNMIQRSVVGGVTFNQDFDVENRLVTVADPVRGGLGTTRFEYDANGQRVRTAPTQTFTDLAFTAQRENMELGLY